ncbi:snaclec coagulation factor IX/factor X-binding protein subunit A-like [Pollicipes pollicipes]|uniref:snaclec coagulation factor IX/factor X-binding protein subunit A-like n=1 Tax=Pollicipes pollicipes TaxID=41117 RepID=UPI0018853849|nr:snaclec coagulation factor IX/factor X-binding protein subunit A-like [Pollicipes pollicipes]
MWCGLRCAALPGCVEIEFEAPVCLLLGCEAGWVGHGGVCVLLSRESTTWLLAEQRCAAQRGGAHLCSLLNAAENAFVGQLVLQAELGNVHIGFVHRPELAPPGKWHFRWSDGSAVDFLAWHERQPGGNPTRTKYASLKSPPSTWVVNSRASVENAFCCKYRP